MKGIFAGPPGLSDSTVLSFSEVHLAFQKVQYLLEDCTRDDARLWMLMNSERVANQFWVLNLTNPVMIGMGHSYDQSSITKWFRAGKPICPETGEKTKNMEVVPNLALKRLIQQYCNENGIPFGDSGCRNHDIGRSAVAGSLAAEGAMKMVVEFVSGSVGIGSNKVAFEIRLLSKTSIFNRSCLVEAGVVPHLLKLLASADSKTQENVVAGLLNLLKHSKGKAVIVENGGVDLVVDVLKEGLKKKEMGFDSSLVSSQLGGTRLESHWGRKPPEKHRRKEAQKGLER
ncbi:putative aminoacyltransferase, E1 ubiquitin-activating enzyme [Rosa chinensis]|uniref:RING-type E3 ubiquitin transferase n=1 Tax=Rosa chinensis TaxID=74649 RepID=A0A2P6RNR2_ROSCH|nr:putative aminoacyltransferase, E1 ubiquitin-activating enzyme [Rosa chinensis]